MKKSSRLLHKNPTTNWLIDIHWLNWVSAFNIDNRKSTKNTYTDHRLSWVSGQTYKSSVCKLTWWNINTSSRPQVLIPSSRIHTHPASFPHPYTNSRRTPTPSTNTQSPFHAEWIEGQQTLWTRNLQSFPHFRPLYEAFPLEPPPTRCTRIWNCPRKNDLHPLFSLGPGSLLLPNPPPPPPPLRRPPNTKLLSLSEHIKPTLGSYDRECNPTRILVFLKIGHSLSLSGDTIYVYVKPSYVSSLHVFFCECSWVGHLAFSPWMWKNKRCGSHLPLLHCSEKGKTRTRKDTGNTQ